jgi:hypothetical protein
MLFEKAAFLLCYAKNKDWPYLIQLEVVDDNDSR